jgi:membrane protein DedA with SNARE-associated domain
MGQLAEGLLSLSGWAALALLFTLPAPEAPAFLDLVLPGELALLLGGVLAQQGRGPPPQGRGPAAAGWWLGPGRRPLHRRRPGRAPRSGRHARPALPDLVLWTGAAAMLWTTAHVLLGYLAGAGWRHIHHLAGRVGLLLAVAVLVALSVAWLLHRPARQHEDEPRQPVAAGRRRD